MAGSNTGSEGEQSLRSFPGSNKKNFSFPSPFFDLASQYMPRNIKDLFKWVEHIYLSNSVVAQCIKRSVQYSITDLDYSGDDEDVTSKMDYLFNDVLDLKAFMGLIGIDLHCYGNSFVSVFFPFDRILKCSSCKMEAPISRVKAVEYQKLKFTGTCRCGHKGVMAHTDRRSADPSRINLVRWDPKQIDIKHNPITGDYSYYYTVPTDIVNAVLSGDIAICATLPEVFLRAVEDKSIIKLNKDSIKHLKSESLAGLSQEWGIPVTFNTFKLHYHNAILRKANECISADYMIPLRFITPSPQMNDPAAMLNMGKFMGFALDAAKRHREDPCDFYALPMPIQYQAVGGEAKALAVDAEIKLTNEEIMNAMGYPQEFFYGSISIQAAPVALRLLENNMRWWVSGMNKLTQWICNKVTKYLSLPTIKVSWTRTTLVDDLEKKNLLLQLVGAQKIADESLLNAIGTSFQAEVKKKYKQQKLELEEQAKFKKVQERIEQEMQSEQGSSPTPMDVKSQAEQLAQQWLQMDENQRKQSMRQVSQQDETVYALAKEVMHRLRNQEGPQPTA